MGNHDKLSFILLDEVGNMIETINVRDLMLLFGCDANTPAPLPLLTGVWMNGSAG
jgi:hypothetical protein